MKWQNLFSEKKNNNNKTNKQEKDITNLPSAEFAHRWVKIKIKPHRDNHTLNDHRTTILERLCSVIMDFSIVFFFFFFFFFFLFLFFVLSRLVLRQMRF